MKNLIDHKQFIANNEIFIDLIHNHDKLALNFHLMPLMGWLNNPNGLCKIKDEYHLYFQYNPKDCYWVIKCWYHVVNKDVMYYQYQES